MATILDEQQFNDSSKGYCISSIRRWYEEDMSRFYTEFVGPDDPRRFAVVLVDLHSNEVIGIGTLTAHPGKRGQKSKVGEITQIYLLEEFRQLGLGHWLMSVLLNKAREFGYGSVFLTTRIEFEDAVRLYRGLGFFDVENTKYAGVANSIALELALS
jgi:ribosomal protein S18 acetylase RimI-like enzyme